VAVGEHLGYLFTGLWSAPAGVALIQSDLLHPLFGIAGASAGPAVRARLLGVRRTVRAPGWKAAGTLVPLAYVGWSLWLLALGVGLLVTA